MADEPAIEEEVEEEIEEEGKDTEQSAGTESGGAILSPEGIMMLALAGLLDLAGVIFTILDLIFGLGEIFSWISDGMGIILFGTWLLITKATEDKPFARATEKVVEKHQKIKQARSSIAKAAKSGAGKGTKRFIIGIIGEIIPVIGILPFWTWFVYSELKNK